MTHLANLQRDQTHLQDVSTLASLTFATSAAIGPTVNMNNSGIVQSSECTARAFVGNVAVPSGQVTSIGCFFERPRIDSDPYRVKAYSAKKDSYLVVGYGPQSPTGTNDPVTDWLAIPFHYQFDDVLLVKPPSDLVTYDNLPLAIGVLIGENTTELCDAVISVQRMSVASPQYSSSVS